MESKEEEGDGVNAEASPETETETQTGPETETENSERVLTEAKLDSFLETLVDKLSVVA